MKIAITTPAGHIGSATADYLLDHGGDVRIKLLGRRPKRLEPFTKRGAEVAVGSQDDADYLTEATHDVDALLWVTPPGFGSDHVRAFQNRLGKAAAAAIRNNAIPRVVNISSIGAQLSAGVGPVNGLHDIEVMLNEAAANVTHLRPGFFFENLLWQIDSIRRSGTISLPILGSKSFPMIATCDIAREAAELAADRRWSGRSVRELHGPMDLSLDEVADTLSQESGRKITYVRNTPTQQRRLLLEHGVSEDIADLLLELYDAIDTGRLQATQPRSPQTTTLTTFARFAREVVVPLLTAEPVGR